MEYAHPASITHNGGGMAEEKKRRKPSQRAFRSTKGVFHYLKEGTGKKEKGENTVLKRKRKVCGDKESDCKTHGERIPVIAVPKKKGGIKDVQKVTLKGGYLFRRRRQKTEKKKRMRSGGIEVETSKEGEKKEMFSNREEKGEKKMVCGCDSQVQGGQRQKRGFGKTRTQN